MTRFMTAVLFSTFTVLTLYNTAPAQNPCGEIGSDCRLMTAEEAKAYKERLLAVKELLPVPDPARYEHDGAAEGSTMPFIAEASFPNAVLTCRSWSGGCFPEDPYNTLQFGYLKKANGDKTTEKQKDPVAATIAVQAMFENRIEVIVWLRPHPYLVDEFSNPDAVNIEKSATFLSWENGEEVVEHHMIFGPRTSKEEETLIVDKPAQNFAPVKSIELLISGPKTEVSVLKKKINQQALQVLLGKVVK
jgi:hypothetical protein